MGDFYRSTQIKKTRKPHTCEQCEQEIAAGSAAFHCKGNYDGCFFSYYCHAYCHAAACDYSDLNGLYGEEWPWFLRNDYERSDYEWMAEHHPAVFARLGWGAKLAAEGSAA